MKIGTLPENERLEALKSYHILDTQHQPDFDGIKHGEQIFSLE